MLKNNEIKDIRLNPQTLTPVNESFTHHVILPQVSGWMQYIRPGVQIVKIGPLTKSTHVKFQCLNIYHLLKEDGG